MKYTIELTNKQKDQMDCIVEIVHRYVGFNPKLEPIEVSWESDLERYSKQAYDKGYEVGYNEGMAKQKDLNFVPLQKCPTQLEDCKAYKLGLEDGNKIADKDLKEIQDSTYDVAYNKGIEDLAHAIKVYYPLNSRERLYYFGINTHADAYAIENPKHLIAKAKAYEEKKKAEEEIKVGDIIYSQMTESKAIIISFNAWNDWNCIDTCGTGFVIDKSKMGFWKKTGHIDNVEEILDKLRGEE